MRKHTIIIIAAAALSAAVSSPPLSLREKEDFLHNARVVGLHHINVGVTNSQRATLDDGKLKHDAHVQTINETKAEFEGSRGKEINFTDKYHYNIAAYELDKILDLNMVPASVERKVNGQSAAVTWWVDDPLMMELERTKKKIEPPDQDRWNKQMHMVRVFHQWTYNTDPNLGNLVIDSGWKLWIIDHTRAFRLHTQIATPANLVRIDRKLLARMKELKKEDLAPKLKPWLSTMQIDGLMKRRDAIVRHFENLVKEQGESAVLYDLL